MMQNVVKAGSRRSLATRALAMAMSAALVACVAGCASKPIVEGKIGTLDKAAVISYLNRQAESTRSVSANLDAKYQSESMGSPEGCGGNLAAMFPDKLRIRGHHDLLDYPPFDIGSDGTTWFAHIHIQSNNRMDLGPTASLDETYDPFALLKPRDVVMALGVGPIIEGKGSELLFTRNPGFYLLTEVVNEAKGHRYVAKRIFIDPDLMAITRMETYRPDAAIDMIAEMTYEQHPQPGKVVPTSATIRLLRNPKQLLELQLKDRVTGADIPVKRFAVPSTEGIPQVIQHPVQTRPS